MRQLIFLGAPGSGKGTQSELLVKNNGYKHISTGDLLRKEISSGTDLGKNVKSIMDSGNLVTDEIVLELLRSNCDLSTGKFIFDGYPRNLVQAHVLVDQFLQGHDFLAVYFEIDLNELLIRLTNRRSCSNCGAIFNLKFSPPQVENVCDKCGHKPLLHRSDDKEDVVAKRIQVFEDTVGPVLKYFNEIGKLVTINAAEDSSSVYKNVLKRL